MNRICEKDQKLSRKAAKVAQRKAKEKTLR
jgi:hypothetical protein